MSKVTGCQTPDPKRKTEFSLTGMTKWDCNSLFSSQSMMAPIAATSA
ncbi:hypothetical protein [Allocoleopsis franciscana]|nr:hypothetical protein [Allocoleopsis franciscana]